MKPRMLTQQKMDKAVKSAISAMIKNISVIAIFVSLGVILLLYLGPEINLARTVVFRLAVPSIVLAISITIVNELWIKNGQRSASEEKGYEDLLKTYADKSDGLYYPTMQEFLDYERDRRYIVEYDRLTRILEREQSIIEKMQANPNKNTLDQLRIKAANKRIIKNIKYRDAIKIRMPYEKSEEFDYLRYNLQDIVYKEYSPNDTRRHLTKARTKKYTSVFTFAIVGLNILSIGGSMGDIWTAVIMTVMAAASLMYAVVKGFSTGYHNINIISTGVYKTANSFIDQAVAYCKKKSKDLYYNGVTEFRQYEPTIEDEPSNLDGSEFFEELEQLEMNLFGKAEREVTKTENKRI